MRTLREKITFFLTATAYCLFHLRLGSDVLTTLTGSLYQVLLTAPYALGFTYIIAVVYKKMSGTGKIPVDRLLRIFFTIGILFGFFFALYEYADRNRPPSDDNQKILPSVSRCLERDNPKVPLYSA